LGGESVPPAVTGDILALCDDLGTAAPLYLDVSPSPGAKFGWCAANVLDRCRREGGEPVYGWLVWTAPELYLNAEFHGVWHDGREMRDITPTQEGETRVLFAPDRRYGADFDFRRRPNNRRFRSYGWTKCEPMVSAKLVETGAAALAYKARRAEKMGVTLRQAIMASLPRDGLETMIDEFLFAAGHTDGMLTVTERGTECMAPYSVAQYHHRAFNTDLIRRKMLGMADLEFHGTNRFSR
jgi:hypothetical protein